MLPTGREVDDLPNGGGSSKQGDGDLLGGVEGGKGLHVHVDVPCSTTPRL